MNESQVYESIKEIRVIFFNMQDVIHSEEYSDTDYYFELKKLKDRIDSIMSHLKNENFRL